MLQIASKNSEGLLLLPEKQSVSGAIDASIKTIRSAALIQPATAKGVGLRERLFDASSNFKVVFSQISMHLPKEWRDALFKQLDSLLDAEEWDERDRPPMRESQLTFIRLLLALKPERRPGLGASEDGHLIATWTQGRDRLTIECLADDHVLWTLARARGEGVERAAGTSVIRRMQSILAPYDPSVWLKVAK